MVYNDFKILKWNQWNNTSTWFYFSVPHIYICANVCACFVGRIVIAISCWTCRVAFKPWIIVHIESWDVYARRDLPQRLPSKDLKMWVPSFNDNRAEWSLPCTTLHVIHLYSTDCTCHSVLKLIVVFFLQQETDIYAGQFYWTHSLHSRRV